MIISILAPKWNSIFEASSILYQLQSLCETMSGVLTSGETSPGKMPFCQTLKWLFSTKILNSHNKVPDYCDNISQPTGFRNRAPTRPWYPSVPCKRSRSIKPEPLTRAKQISMATASRSILTKRTHCNSRTCWLCSSNAKMNSGNRKLQCMMAHVVT